MKTRRLPMGLCFALPLIFALLVGIYSCSDDKTTEPGDVNAPAAITNLATGTVTNTTVVLTWTAPGDDGATGTAHQYDIRYSTSVITGANFASATPVTGEPTPAEAGTAQTMTVTGLTPETPYHFAMKTADEVPNWSAISNVVQATTLATVDVTAPAEVANLATGTVTSTTIALTWTAPGDDGNTGTAHQYDIRYSTAAITDANFASATPVSGPPAPAVAGTAQTVTVTGLTPGTPYHFAMKTADEVPNWSALSNAAQATTETPDVTAPAAIENLATGTVAATTVVLTWTAPGDDGSTGTAHQYDIRYSTAAITDANFASATPVSGAPAPAVAGTAQTVTVTGLTPETPYHFAMKTADEVPNWSALSNAAQATTLPPPDATPPAAVANLATGAVTATTVVLTWTAPGDDGSTGTAHVYDIRYSTAAITDANFASATPVSGAPAPAVAGTGQTVTVTSLTPGTPYHFAMKTADEVPNWSALSNAAQATTLPAPDVTAPAAVANLATGTVTATTIVLTWTAPGDDGSTGTAHQYDIRYSTAAITDANFASATPVSGVPAPAVAGTAQTVTVTGLTPDTPYHFAMKTADEVPNWSALSNAAQATTLPPPDATPPAAITDLSAAAVDSITVELTWTAPGDDGPTGTAHAYDIRRSATTITEANWASATQLTGEPAPTVAGSVQHMTVPGLQSSHDYFFAMKTMDEVPNTSSLSNVATVHTPSSQTSPPGLFAPVFPDSVCISSSDTYAQYAKLLVSGQLSLAKAYSQMASFFYGPLQNADWQHSGDCWDYGYSVGGCSWQYHACQTGADYTYTLTVNGSCSGDTYDNWVAYRFVGNEDTRSGTFYVYDTNSTTIQVAWVSEWAADQLSGTYTFYEGDPATAPVQTIIQWSESADGNVFDMTWITPDSDKWVSHFQKVPCSGTSQSFLWDGASSQWWLQNDIAWYPDGTGLWDVYDDTGALQEHHVW